MGSNLFWVLTKKNEIKRFLLKLVLGVNQKKMKSKDFCFLDLNLSCFKPRGPPEKFYIAKIFLIEKSCSTNINKQLCQRTKNSYRLSFRDNWGDKFVIFLVSCLQKLSTIMANKMVKFSKNDGSE